MTLITALILVFAPVANAYSYTYANSVVTPENEVRYSGFQSLISYGYAATELFDYGGATSTLHVETYHPYPGYQTVVYASGGQSVGMYHTRENNAHQKCRWDWAWAGGNLGSVELTCRLNS